MRENFDIARPDVAAGDRCPCRDHRSATTARWEKEAMQQLNRPSTDNAPRRYAPRGAGVVAPPGLVPSAALWFRQCCGERSTGLTSSSNTNRQP